ncbi:putative leucine-rich repeat receptor-like protein kinase isoform X1 [Iris pallida]|uniref:Leucine-rich repeat receptor-like protein kinase isoform X1 n=1 Tax=Iris pallida TaxID=29817 RepID=A0AAX6ESY3_IRIPA|nr:putative leucine-rich repeat receptor-like protein kinase isoform X1 [Iris pallida]
MKWRFASSVLLLLLLSFFFFFLIVGGDDSQTMHALSRLLSPLPYKWSTTTDQNPCSWDGVTCSSSAANASSSSSPHVRVTHLSLSGARLFSPYIYGGANAFSISYDFFNLLCKLDSLQSLDLSYNHFTYIDTSFLSNCSGLSQLKSLDLSSNNLADTSLGNFSSFPGLETLDMSNNQLGLGGHGGVHKLHGLSNLKSLNLSSNLFAGSFSFLQLQWTSPVEVPLPQLKQIGRHSWQLLWLSWFRNTRHVQQSTGIGRTWWCAQVAWAIQLEEP